MNIKNVPISFIDNKSKDDNSKCHCYIILAHLIIDNYLCIVGVDPSQCLLFNVASYLQKIQVLVFIIFLTFWHDEEK